MFEEKIYTISELGRVVTGKTPPTKVRSNYGGDVPFICIPDLGNKVYINSADKSLSIQGVNTVRNCLLPANAIMVSCIATLGKIGITTRPSVTNQQINSVIPNQQLVDPLFLYYRLSDFTEILSNHGGGGSVFNIVSKSKFEEIEISLPPLPLQHRIAEILGALDDKIELNRQMNHTLEQMAQALYKHYFVDDINPENLPEGWKNGTIYELATVIYGAPFASTEFNEIGLGLPLIRIRDLKTFKPQFYTTERHPNASTINKGDVLVGMDAEFRPCIWVGDYGYLNQRVCQFKPIRKEVHPYFIYSIIKPHLDFFEKSKVGTTVIHLGKADIDEFNVIVPSIQVQQNFNAAVDPLYSLLILSSSESQHLMNLRDVLLPKLISGEIIPADLQAIEQAL